MLCEQIVVGMPVPPLVEWTDLDDVTRSAVAVCLESWCMNRNRDEALAVIIGTVELIEILIDRMLCKSDILLYSVLRVALVKQKNTTCESTR